MAAPIILCDCAGMDEKRWLECREHGPKGDIEYTVGGSDVATIFGLSPWTTPLELWMIKKGRMKPKAKPNPLYELRERTGLVQEFDRLADDIVAEALRIAEEHSVEERIVFVPTRELVLA